MIARCECGKLQTVQPYMNAAEIRFMCYGCSEDKQDKRKLNDKR